MKTVIKTDESQGQQMVGKELLLVKVFSPEFRSEPFIAGIQEKPPVFDGMSTELDQPLQLLDTDNDGAYTVYTTCSHGVVFPWHIHELLKKGKVGVGNAFYSITVVVASGKDLRYKQRSTA